MKMHWSQVLSHSWYLRTCSKDQLILTSFLFRYTKVVQPATHWTILCDPLRFRGWTSLFHTNKLIGFHDHNNRNRRYTLKVDRETESERENVKWCKY